MCRYKWGCQIGEKKKRTDFSISIENFGKIHNGCSSLIGQHFNYWDTARAKGMGVILENMFEIELFEEHSEGNLLKFFLPYL